MIVEHDKMPVIMSNDYCSMEQKNTVFIRGLRDSRIKPFGRKFNEGHYNLVPPSGKEGFTGLERALRVAAWSVCQEYAAKNEFGCAGSGFYAWQGEKNQKQVVFNNDKEASLVVKDAAMFLGADLVGIAEFNPAWVYSSWYDFSTGESIPARFPFKPQRVIALALESDYGACLTSPSLISCAATGLSYSGMAEIARKMAIFIRLLGYEAIPCGNDTAMSIPIAVQAGLGEVGRNGMLITPQYGPRTRLLEIFTDMPLQTDKPITFGVSQFCSKCRKCAQTCPAKAIPTDPKPTFVGPSISNCPGVFKWYIDPEKCYKFWAANGGECNNCIACCPYNKWSSWHHGLTKWFADSIQKKSLFSLTTAANNPTRLMDIGPTVLINGTGSIKIPPISSEKTGVQVAYAVCQASRASHDYIGPDGGTEKDSGGFYQWQLHPAKCKVDCGDPVQAAVIIKRAARFLGADLVGITKTKTPVDFPFQVGSVVVMAIEMDYEVCGSGSTLMVTAAIGLGYSRMAETANKLAVFIRELGYRAIPCGDEIAPSISLAIMAGLGERGRNGLLVTGQYGPRVRLCKIFTDMEIKTDQPRPFALTNHCTGCRECVDACPAGAISGGEQGKWVVDSAGCYRFWKDNDTDCCRCIVSCPLNKPAAWETDLNQSLADIYQISSLGQSGVDNLRSRQKNVQSWWNK